MFNRKPSKEELLAELAKLRFLARTMPAVVESFSQHPLAPAEQLELRINQLTKKLRLQHDYFEPETLFEDWVNILVDDHAKEYDTYWLERVEQETLVVHFTFPDGSKKAFYKDGKVPVYPEITWGGN